MEHWGAVEIRQKTQTIKREYKKTVTNYYKPIEGAAFDVCQTEKSIVFGIQDHLVYRVYFYTAAIDELPELLKAYPDEATIDIIARRRDDLTSLLEQLVSAGYSRYALFERYHILNLKEGIYTKIPDFFQGQKAMQYGRYATEEDAEEILRLLENAFDHKESHLQDMKRLKHMINNKNVRVISEDSKIVTVVTFWYEGKKEYIEHVVNIGCREYAHALYLSAFEIAVSNGINYAYTWIKSTNRRMQRFGSRFGYEKEDIVDYIYVKGE